MVLDFKYNKVSVDINKIKYLVCFQGEDSVVGCLVPGAAVNSYYNKGTDTEILSPVTHLLCNILTMHHPCIKTLTLNSNSI